VKNFRVRILTLDRETIEHLRKNPDALHQAIFDEATSLDAALLVVEGHARRLVELHAIKAKVYGCATHRRKGATICPNGRVIALTAADEAVLTVVERALDGELLAAVVDRAADKLDAQRDQTAGLTTERDRLNAEIRNLTAAIAAGGDLASLVEVLREREQRGRPSSASYRRARRRSTA
jgi:hypothetical protein